MVPFCPTKILKKLLKGPNPPAVQLSLSRMVGTQKWSMEEILWVITMVKQGLKDEEIYEKFCEIFKNARHVKGASSIKYCRTGFMKQEE